MRGRVYRIDLGDDVGLKPFVVVSNNQRNVALQSSLAVRITTSVPSRQAAVAPLSQADPLVGHALCDRITIIYPDEAKAELGALSPPTMRAVETGLMVALGISR
ncbi:MAG TPA: type II toxin-antitoxin system PemK/MazF family toxin [Kineosporiaceae bacterium]|nr:type II toxin-antitoxin system PemK/MazF family toxin [Kineosporiaceae bacterium]